jgi:hypothetical protein
VGCGRRPAGARAFVDRDRDRDRFRLGRLSIGERPCEDKVLVVIDLFLRREVLRILHYRGLERLLTRRRELRDLDRGKSPYDHHQRSAARSG